MATNWNRILTNTRNLNDVIAILRKILAQMGELKDLDFKTIWQKINLKADLTETYYKTDDAALEFKNGTLQHLVLSDDDVLSSDLKEGQSITLILDLNNHRLVLGDFVADDNFYLKNDGSQHWCVITNFDGINHIVLATTFYGDPNNTIDDDSEGIKA